MMHLDRVHGVLSCIFLKQNLALAHFNEQSISNLPQQLTHNLNPHYKLESIFNRKGQRLSNLLLLNSQSFGIECKQIKKCYPLVQDRM